MKGCKFAKIMLISIIMALVCTSCSDICDGYDIKSNTNKMLSGSNGNFALSMFKESGINYRKESSIANFIIEYIKSLESLRDSKNTKDLKRFYSSSFCFKKSNIESWWSIRDCKIKSIEEIRVFGHGKGNYSVGARMVLNSIVNQSKACRDMDAILKIQVIEENRDYKINGIEIVPKEEIDKFLKVLEKEGPYLKNEDKESRIAHSAILDLRIDRYIPSSVGEDYSKVQSMDTATIKSILRDNDAKTVAIIISTASGKSQGSGFFIKPGVVVTNFHVINNGVEGQVRTVDGKVYEIDGVISASSIFDLAVLKLKDRIGESVKFGDPSKLEKADPVMAIGSPLGLYNTVTVGMYVNRWEEDNGVVTLQCSLPLAPGNSGGPLFNTQGEVIGINTAIAKGYGDIAFARSIEHIKEISHKLKKLDFVTMKCTRLSQIDWNNDD